MENFKKKLLACLDQIPIDRRKSYVITLCSIVIIIFAIKSLVKIVDSTEGWDRLSTTDNQEISQQQLSNLSDELNRVHDFFSSSRDSFLMKVEELDSLNRVDNDEN